MSHKTYDIADLVKTAARELKMRENVYPKWVHSGKMKAEAAEREIKNMRDILELLITLKAGAESQ